MFGRVTITLGIGPHSSCGYFVINARLFRYFLGENSNAPNLENFPISISLFDAIFPQHL